MLAQGSGLQPINTLFEEDARHVTMPKGAPGQRLIHVFNDGPDTAQVRLVLVSTVVPGQPQRPLRADRSLVGQVETYSRVMNGQLLIWRMSRLRELAAMLKRRTVRVADIPELNKELWFGGPRTVRATCKEVASHAVRSSPPTWLRRSSFRRTVA
jgi:hypothetical protein